MLGLFTTKAYAEPASQTPLLHRKLRQILRSEDLIEGSHDYKAAVSLFDSFPKDELFAASTDDLRGAVVALLALQGEQVRLLGRRDPDAPQRVADRRAAALALRRRAADAAAGAVPRALRDRRGRLPPRARRGRPRAGPLPRPRLRAACPTSTSASSSARSWPPPARGTTSCATRWSRATATTQGRALATEWGARFPRYYKASTTAALAVHDIGCFARLETLGEPFVVGLQNESDERGERTRVGLYKSGGKVELSAAMPMLEDLGLRVIEEVPTRLTGGDEDTWVQDFGVLGPGDKPIDLEAHGARVADCISAVWRGDTESDPLNRLVLAAGPRLAPDRDPARLPQVPPAHRLALHRELPERRAGRERGADREPRARCSSCASTPSTSATRRPRRRCARRSCAALDAVESLDHDRILRNQLGLIEATLRTNAYRRGRGAMSFKLRSADVPAIPEPAPLVEIYVYSAEMEGIHLRGGRIARGGIRWSDRMDYRTEVYGLMRAQLTKNAQIVPDGREGRLLPQAPPGGPDRAARGGPAPVRRLRARRCSTSPTTSSTARSSTRPTRACSTATTPTSWSPPTRARRRSRTPPTRSRRTTASGSATRSPPAARPATTTRSSGSPRAGRGSRSSATSSSSSSTSRRTRSRSSGSATCRATCSATGCCCRTASAWSPPTTTATSSSTPTRTRTSRSPSASGCSASPARPGTTTTARRSRRAAASGRAPPSGSRCRRRRSARWGSRTTRSRPTT